MSTYLMKCGHVANATTSDGKPCCAICAGIREGYDQIDHEVSGTDGLEGRKAICWDSKNDPHDTIVQSSWNLPFFKYCPDKEYDEYYDGSYGWD